MANEDLIGTGIGTVFAYNKDKVLPDTFYEKNKNVSAVGLSPVIDILGNKDAYSVVRAIRGTVLRLGDKILTDKGKRWYYTPSTPEEVIKAFMEKKMESLVLTDITEV